MADDDIDRSVSHSQRKKMNYTSVDPKYELGLRDALLHEALLGVGGRGLGFGSGE